MNAFNDLLGNSKKAAWMCFCTRGIHQIITVNQCCIKQL